MKILLSAYACEPNKGSEPAVGWNWAVQLSRQGHEVCVITRSNNRPGIEAALAESPLPNVRFEYVDFRWRSWKKWGFGLQLYYLLWQVLAFFRARQLLKSQAFDGVHHVTFVSARQPSFMGLLGIPFIFGPVAGGESVPAKLRNSANLKTKLYEGIRDCLNAAIQWDPLMHLTFLTAERICVTSHQTLKLIPQRYRDKTSVQLAIGIEPDWKAPSLLTSRARTEVSGLRVLYVGNLFYLKGMHLGLSAFAELHHAFPDSRLTIVGQGPEAVRLRAQAESLGIAQAIEWRDWMPREVLPEIYAAHDVLIFPSMRDSGGMVVLEALRAGLPCVCLNLGGPSVMVTSACGYRIEAQGCEEADVAAELAAALKALASNDRETVARMQQAALKRAHDFSWDKPVLALYPPVVSATEAHPLPMGHPGVRAHS